MPTCFVACGEMRNDALADCETFLEFVDVHDFLQVEEAMQETMDSYAGGIKTGYGYSENQLKLAEKEIKEIEKLTDKLGVLLRTSSLPFSICALILRLLSDVNSPEP